MAVAATTVTMAAASVDVMLAFDQAAVGGLLSTSLVVCIPLRLVLRTLEPKKEDTK